MPVCFVIMGFGQKTDLATGRVLDLDKSYRNIIKPAVTAAGYDCVRADEIQHSGVIDVPNVRDAFRGRPGRRGPIDRKSERHLRAGSAPRIEAAGDDHHGGEQVHDPV